MAGVSKLPEQRATFPVSRGELERRWAALRGAMRLHDIDALVVQGSNNLAGIGGNLRWLTGLSAAGSYPQTILFPVEGRMTLVAHGERDGVTEFASDDALMPGIGKRCTAPMFPSVTYTGDYDARLVAREIERAGFRTVALAGLSSMYATLPAMLKAELPNVCFTDASALIDPLRAAKSDEEVAGIRRAAAMQDEILERVCEHIKPGMRDFEVMAYASYVGQLLGSETGYFLGSSAAPDHAAQLRPRSQQGRTIDPGDVFFFQAENTGPGGYFVHMARTIVLGKASPALRASTNTVIEAQDATIDLLVSGLSFATIYQRYAMWLEERALPPETRLHAHGQGYDVVERPLLRYDETLEREDVRLNIGVHPSIIGPRTFASICDNFLVEETVAERLHETRRGIIEI